MKNERVFLRCEKCGNIVELVEDSGIGMMCCGERMKRLMPNTADAATEKHVPSAEKTGNTLTVKVGSVPHPMTPGHHINWICVAQGNLSQRAELPPEGNPEAQFSIGPGAITIYAYCNLHGLWASEA